MPPPRLPAFAPLRHRNLRLFFTGQGISLVGSWMQTVGQAWLVLTLTRSPFLLGLVNALQWLPTLVFSLPAGVLVDRVPKRVLIMWTQAMFLLLALVLGLLTVAGRVQYWHVAALAALLGTVNAIDVPARQAFIVEMVGGTDDLTGAIALNSSVFNGARLVGPGLAGLMISAWGVGTAFLANAASFLAVIAALAAMRLEKPVIRAVPGTGWLMHIAEGLAFIRADALVLRVLITLGLLSVFVMNFSLYVPVLARLQLHLGPSGFGFLLAAQGLGALAASLLVAHTGGRGPQASYLGWGALLLCGGLLALSQVGRPDLAGAELFFAGGGMVMFTATSNSTVQLATPDALRGRVMSVYAMVFNGLAPVGSLMMGAVIDAWGPRLGLLVGGAAGLLGVGILRAAFGARASSAVPEQAS